MTHMVHGSWTPIFGAGIWPMAKRLWMGHWPDWTSNWPIGPSQRPTDEPGCAWRADWSLWKLLSSQRAKKSPNGPNQP